MTTTQKIPNRLAKEKSPYLLQHANNPVNWYPWGEEAFQIAKKENKPVFLSIGYSGFAHFKGYQNGTQCSFNRRPQSGLFSFYAQ